MSCQVKESPHKGSEHHEHKKLAWWTIIFLVTGIAGLICLLCSAVFH